MKCIKAFWDGEDMPPLTTFVLRKKDVAVLLDMHTKNPRSQWWMVGFHREWLVACDAFRAMVADCGDGEFVRDGDDDDVHHLPTSVIKSAIKGNKVAKGEPGGWSYKETTALFIVSDDAGNIYVHTIETDNKKWDFFDGDKLYELDCVFSEKVEPPKELGPAVPQMEQIDQFLDWNDSLADNARRETPAKMRFKPAFLATFGHLDKVGLGHPATMTIPQSPLDAAIFKVEAGDGDCTWRYLLMPLRKPSG